MRAKSGDAGPIRPDLNNMMSPAVGKEHGIQPEEIDANAAYALLGRKGYEDLRRKIEGRPKPHPKCVL